ncbi:MAG: histidinol-phosphate transaminase [Fidelibacterota bacterium]|nr:MAG: histidinol-phosphate transaminase [Candidatus Neomarinimicrobiota bacterium]
MIDLPLKQWIKPEVLAQPAYEVKTADYRIKLNQNESPSDWPRELKAEVLKRLKEAAWNRYPLMIHQRLKEKLANGLAVSPEQVVIGKGSNEVLQALAHITLRPGDTLCTLSPTFAVYRLLGEQQQALVSTSPLTVDFQVDEEDLLDRSKEARLTILSNPNSPTGSLLPIELIGQVVRQAQGLVVVDEAYVDFSGVSALPLLEQFSNLIITRTFSKAFALAGFRLGFAIMHSQLAQQVQKGLLPFNIDTPSAVAAEVLLDHREVVKERAALTIRERDQLIARLGDLPGVTVWPSWANFFLLATPLGAQKTFTHLAKTGILVRDVSDYPGCENVVRITVGTPEENEALFQAVRDLL